MSRITRLFEVSREKSPLRDEKLQTVCGKCGKRPAANSDGLCNQCRFDDVLTQLTEKK